MSGKGRLSDAVWTAFTEALRFIVVPLVLVDLVTSNYPQLSTAFMPQIGTFIMFFGGMIVASSTLEAIHSQCASFLLSDRYDCTWVHLHPALLRNRCEDDRAVRSQEELVPVGQVEPHGPDDLPVDDDLVHPVDVRGLVEKDDLVIGEEPFAASRPELFVDQGLCSVDVVLECRPRVPGRSEFDLPRG